MTRQPLYQVMAALLRHEIRTRLQPGDQLETEPQLAARCRASIGTVRQALQLLVQEGLIERRHGSGSYVRDPRGMRQEVAVIAGVNLSRPGTSYYFLRLAQMLQVGLTQRGLPVRLYLNQRAPDCATPDVFANPLFLQDLKDNRLCGVVAIGMYPHPDWEMPIRQAGVAFVDARPEFMIFPQEARLRAAVRALAAQGCQRFALIAHEDAMASRFRAALAAEKLPVTPAWLQAAVSPEVPNAALVAFRQLWRSRRSRPDAIIVADDILSRELTLNLLTEGIRVPEELQLAVFANRGSGISYPFPVIRLEIDPDEVAAVLCARLHEALRAAAPAPTTQISFRVFDDYSGTTTEQGAMPCAASA